MNEAYVVAVEGLDRLDGLTKVPDAILKAARLAVNKTTERARATSAREMREQINFPARYLSGEDGRLAIVKRASGADLEGIVRGRDRPTSLARFMRGSRKGGVTVSVKPGGARFMPRAFAIKLKSGTADLGVASNLGLALRTKKGERPKGAYKPKQIGPNLWLLYGPSVDQVFRGVADEVAPEMAVFMEGEFGRLLDVELA